MRWGGSPFHGIAALPLSTYYHKQRNNAVGGSPFHGLAAFLRPTYTTEEEAMRWGGSPSHGIAALPLSTYTSTGGGGWVIRNAH